VVEQRCDLCHGELTGRACRQAIEGPPEHEAAVLEARAGGRSRRALHERLEPGRRAGIVEPGQHPQRAQPHVALGALALEDRDQRRHHLGPQRREVRDRHRRVDARRQERLGAVGQRVGACGQRAEPDREHQAEMPHESEYTRVDRPAFLAHIPGMATQRERIQDLLTRDPSPERAELLQLGFDALAAEPLSTLVADPALAALIASALTRDNAQRLAERHLVTAAGRVQTRLSSAPDRVRDAMPADVQERLAALVHAGKGPRFGWLKGAIDPGDLRQLLAPVVQQVLGQFTAKLPIPGLGGSSGSSPPAGLGGLVGMLGKQVSKSASQLADVGKSVIGGLSSELQNRLGALTRDFSQTAVSEFRAALGERLKSDEGQEIVQRIRDRVVAHVLDTRLTLIVDDFLQLPIEDVTFIAAGVAGHQPGQALFQDLLAGEIQGVLGELGTRSLHDVLSEAGIADDARAFCIRAVEPGLKKLVASDAFADWLDRLLAATATP
jgi:hypothetical protein